VDVSGNFDAVRRTNQSFDRTTFSICETHIVFSIVNLVRWWHAKHVEIKPKLRQRLHLPSAEGQEERAYCRSFYRKESFERGAYVSQSAHTRALRRRAFVTAKVRANFNLRGSQDVLRL
jgi:hypothetical protein